MDDVWNFTPYIKYGSVHIIERKDGWDHKLNSVRFKQIGVAAHYRKTGDIGHYVAIQKYGSGWLKKSNSVILYITRKQAKK